MIKLLLIILIVSGLFTISSHIYQMGQISIQQMILDSEKLKPDEVLRCFYETLPQGAG